MSQIDKVDKADIGLTNFITKKVNYKGYTTIAGE